MLYRCYMLQNISQEMEMGAADLLDIITTQRQNTRDYITVTLPSTIVTMIRGTDVER